MFIYLFIYNFQSMYKIVYHLNKVFLEVEMNKTLVFFLLYCVVFFSHVRISNKKEPDIFVVFFSIFIVGMDKTTSMQLCIFTLIMSI